ncbi:MAG: MoaD/ThiS family protein [Dehalococcoidia bacterium]|nr:MoaD/ThiS family protein [Dehalococcoidia bacterium]
MNIAMRVSIFLFAAFREKAGSGRLQIEMAEGATAGDALRRVAQDVPQIARLLGSAALAVNAEYAGPDVRLKDGDEVALIPPVSGGASRVATASITEKSIDADAAIAGLVRPADGALVVFQGVVRAFTDGRRLLHMEYEA